MRFHARSHRVVRRFGLGLVACLVVAAAVSSGVGDEPEPVSPEKKLTGEVAREMVDRIVAEVEEIRGLQFKRPVPVEVIDDACARRYMIERLDTFQTEDELRSVERAYAVLGLVPPGFDILEAYLAALEEQAGGFYDPSSGAFYLLDDIPRGLAEVVTAHELTHALEDQHFDLDRRLRDSIHDDDRLFALSSVHEGSASLLMTVFLAQQVMAGELDAEALQEYAESEAARAETLLDLPEVLRRQLVAPYVLGSSFVAGGNMFTVLGGGFPLENAGRVFADGPVSSEQILHPEKFWEDSPPDTPTPVTLGDAGKALGRRWIERFEGVLGEITLGLLVGAPTPEDLESMALYDGKAWTNLAASGWDGDRWQLWIRGDDAVVLLTTVWDSPDDAEQFERALKGREDLAWKLSGDRVAIVAGDAGKKTDRLLHRILDARVEGPEESE